MGGWQKQGMLRLERREGERVSAFPKQVKEIGHAKSELKLWP